MHLSLYAVLKDGKHSRHGLLEKLGRTGCSELRKDAHISLELIDISSWAIEEAPLTGSRVKNTVISPDGESFVFKEPSHLREVQVWSEVLASYIAGDELGWAVQTSRIAYRDGVFGNLHGYVFDPATEQMIEGWRFCLDCDPDFDFEKGNHHTFPLLQDVATEICNGRYRVSENDFFRFWGKALAFDTLISNGDRHAENWAVIIGKDADRMAPLYDNGSSLGCGIDAKGLERWFNERGIVGDKLRKFARNGRHHLRPDAPYKKGGLFNDVNRLFLDAHPDQKESFQMCAELSLERIGALIERTVDLKGLPDSYCVTEQRAEHLKSLLQSGQERLKRLLSESESP